MDKRCPRRLSDLPSEYCPLAVQRLKAIQHAGKYLNEEEEAKLPGCKWAVRNQMANYCFFKYLASEMPNKPLADMEIAHMCGVSMSDVKATEKQALEALRNTDTIEEIEEQYENDRKMDT